jgi:hypothetical protein
MTAQQTACQYRRTTSAPLRYRRRLPRRSRITTSVSSPPPPPPPPPPPATGPGTRAAAAATVTDAGARESLQNDCPYRVPISASHLGVNGRYLYNPLPLLRCELPHLTTIRIDFVLAVRHHLNGRDQRQDARSERMPAIGAHERQRHRRSAPSLILLPNAPLYSAHTEWMLIAKRGVTRDGPNASASHRSEAERESGVRKQRHPAC